MCWNAPVKAKVRNNQLVVFVKKGIERSIWMRDAAALLNTNFRIDAERDGTFALRCVMLRARGEEIETIARFEKADVAQAALAEISGALMCGRLNNQATNAEGVVVTAHMPRWASVSLLVLVPATILLLYVAHASGYARLMGTFMEVYWSGMGGAAMAQQSEDVAPAAASAQTAAPSIPTREPAPQPIDTKATGVPMSADDFLNTVAGQERQ